jgi:Tfp pilus assembly protein PilZ
MQENRRHKRYTLKIMEVEGKMIFASDVKIIDISIDGISVKANKRLNIGSEYLLKLDDKKKTISLKGAVVWSSLSESREGPGGASVPIYTVGMKFNNISVEKITELLEFIEGHKKEEVPVTGGQRLNIRFRMKDPGNATLNFPATYKVKTISLGGMLIECMRDLQVDSRIPMELSVHDDKPVTFVGRVVSCNVIGGGGQRLYGIGIEFLDLTDQDREVLSTFMEYCNIVEIGNEADATADKAVDEDIPGISPEFLDKVEYLWKWHKTIGYYKVLGIKENASDREIKLAFRAMTQEFHPDKMSKGSDDLKHKIREIFSYAAAAHATLIDPKLRKEYDTRVISKAGPEIEPVKVIVHYANGRLIKGHANDFSPARPSFHVLPIEFGPADKGIEVPIRELKALFFVKDFTGNRARFEKKEFTKGQQISGRKVEVTFADGEVLVGSVLGYDPQRLGFFVTPADSQSNNLRVFVVSAAVKNFRFL